MDKKENAKSEPSVKAKREELVLQRQAELEKYHQELVDFCDERNIELTATVTVGGGGNDVRIHMVDKL